MNFSIIYFLRMPGYDCTKMVMAAQLGKNSGSMITTYANFVYWLTSLHWYCLLLIQPNFCQLDLLLDRFCSRCKEQSQASKNLDLWRRLPEVSVIHLSNSVAHKWGPERQPYEPLCSHYASMASGHYTAHIKVGFFNVPYIYFFTS